MNEIIQKPHIAVEAEKGRRMTFGAEIGIFILVFIIGSVAAAIIPSIYEMYIMLTDEQFMADIEQTILNQGGFSDIMDMALNVTDTMYIITLFCTIIPIAAALIYCICIEKRSMYSMGITKKHVTKSYMTGILLGFILFSLCIGIAALFGGIKFKGINSETNAGIVILYLLGFVIQGFSEEITFRGYFMISLMKKNSLIKAVLINSLAFAIAHMLNPGLTFIAFLNLMLIGIFFSLYVIRTNDIWGAAAYHSMWNFAQGILYGISVSGTNMNGSVLKMEGTGASIISGGSFGIEGSIITTIVTVAAIAVFIYMKPAKEEMTATTSN